MIKFLPALIQDELLSVTCTCKRMVNFLRNYVYVTDLGVKWAVKLKHKQTTYVFKENRHSEPITVKPMLSDHIKQYIFLAFQTGGCLLLHESSAESSCIQGWQNIDRPGFPMW